MWVRAGQGFPQEVVLRAHAEEGVDRVHLRADVEALDKGLPRRALASVNLSPSQSTTQS